MAKRLIDANELITKIQGTASEVARKAPYDAEWFTRMAQRQSEIVQIIAAEPTVDAVEVGHGYNEGDVCFYGFHDENKSLALVEIVKILNDERGVAEVRFLKVFVDDTGNGIFDYLLRSGNTMNVSIKYLRNITPNCGAKMDGGKDGR